LLVSSLLGSFPCGAPEKSSYALVVVVDPLVVVDNPTRWRLRSTLLRHMVDRQVVVVRAPGSSRLVVVAPLVVVVVEVVVVVVGVGVVVAHPVVSCSCLYRRPFVYLKEYY
jgi:hypothetical protein